MDHTIDIPQEVRSPKHVPQTSSVAVRKSPRLNPGQGVTPSNPSSGCPRSSLPARKRPAGVCEGPEEPGARNRSATGRLPVPAADPAYEAHLPALVQEAGTQTSGGTPLPATVLSPKKPACKFPPACKPPMRVLWKFG
ncbi:hypothetical protein NL676_003759 [Syzygium grande]|nr:hypothetical protein NL676_003759 [Syzygium grande]